MNAVCNVIADSWRYIIEPLVPSAWYREIRRLLTITPADFLHNLRNELPKAAIYYALLSPLVAMPLYNIALFHPSMAGDYGLQSIKGVPCRNVFFPSANGKKLHAWLFNKPGASKTVLISHGNAGNLTDREGLVSLILDAGASVFVYDYQGYGKSQGSPSMGGICEDGDSAYKHLIENEGVKPSDLIVFGESIGTGVASATAAGHPCAGIILQSAYTSLPALAREKMFLLRLYPNFMFPPTRLDSLSVLTRPHPPVLLVHGVKDTLIPIAHSEKLYSCALAPKYFARLPEAGHNDIYEVNSDLYVKALRDFISSLP